MKRLLLILFIGMFLVSFISAESFGTFQQSESINLIQTCSDCTYNNITTIKLANGSLLNVNENMEKEGSFYNWTLNESHTNALGTYYVNGIGDLSGTNTIWAYTFDVTPTGNKVSTGNAIMVFLSVLLFFILGSILFSAVFKAEKLPIKATYGISSFMMFLIGLNIISITLPDALINSNAVSFLDSFTAIFFIAFWFAAGLLIITWILTFFYNIFYKKNIRAAEKYG